MIGSVCKVTAAVAVVPAVVIFGAGLVKLASEYGDRPAGVVEAGGGVGLAILAVLVWSGGVFQGAFGEALDALADMADSTNLLAKVERNPRGAAADSVATELEEQPASSLPSIRSAREVAAPPVSPSPLSATSAASTRACPHCGAVIPADVNRCKHCMKKVD